MSYYLQKEAGGQIFMKKSTTFLKVSETFLMFAFILSLNMFSLSFEHYSLQYNGFHVSGSRHTEKTLPGLGKD